MRYGSGILVGDIVKVKLTITTNVKKPKVGEQYCDWGIAGRVGFWCERIKEIRDTHIILESGDKISLDQYYGKNTLYSPDAKIKIEW